MNARDRSEVKMNAKWHEKGRGRHERTKKGNFGKQSFQLSLAFCCCLSAIWLQGSALLLSKTFFSMQSSLLAHLKPKGTSNPFAELEAAAQRRGE
eukprot:4597999-Amphidinium_carterae.1